MEKMVAVLAWPVVALIVTLVALFLFRAPFAALITRTRKVGKSGLETFDGQPPQPTEDKKGVDEFFRSFDSPLLVEAEQLIIKDLKERKIGRQPTAREHWYVHSHQRTSFFTLNMFMACFGQAS